QTCALPLSTSTLRTSICRGGILSNAMAPSGTRYCPPAMARGPVKRTPVIDLCDDEGPKYRGGSSDEDAEQACITDIKPATFTKSSRNPDREKVMESPVATGDVGNRFKEIVGSAFYVPP